MRDDLPSGTITFLFTDVEGSTKLLHDLGAEVYADALAEHRQVIREACAAQGGAEVDTQGDAFFFAFQTAPGALAAARAFTGRLAAAGPIRVRVGLHTGAPLVTEEGYVGDDVHRAARIAAAGHGGQVLVSASTASLVETELLDLGEHRFKDLSAPERVFQLGEDEFPPLKTLHQTNLPVPQTSFLGREKELGEVLALLAQDEIRLLTLTGPGGTGKTRLAAQAAGSVAERFAHGVFWVPLAPLRDPGLVLESASQILGAKNRLAAHIADKRMLLLFDNFEQVVEAAPVLSELLGECPHLELLVTSREPLHVSGEQEYPVPPFAAEEGVGFFAARARAVKPDFEVDEAVPEICKRLDELPLALELAAARVKALSTEQILSRLEQRLPLLTGGTRDAPERQRTLRSTIEWSHDLLLDKEQQLFRRLAVFTGGCTLEAAEEVCDADLDTLQSLVEKSLLRFTNERYWMLETIREYATEQLVATGEESEFSARHARWFSVLAEMSESEWVGANAAGWFVRIESEIDNLRSAVTWGLVNDRPLALALIVNIWNFWLQTGRVPEEKRLLEAAWTDDAPVGLRMRVLRALTAAALGLNDIETVIAASKERLELARATEDLEQQAAAMNMLASGAHLAGDRETARQVFEASLALHRKIGNRTRLSSVLGNFARFERDEGNLAKSRLLLEENMAIAREDGDEVDIAWVAKELAQTATGEGAFDEARALLEEGLEITARLGLTVIAGDLVFALADLANNMGRAHKSAVLFGAFTAFSDREGFEVLSTTTWWWVLRDKLTVALGAGEFAALMAEGRSLDHDAAVFYASECLDQLRNPER